MASCFKIFRKKYEVNLAFMENGRKLLEELVVTCDGRSNIPICTYSAQELQQATNNCDHGRIMCEGGDFRLYHGLLEDRPVSIKKYWSNSKYYLRMSLTDIAFGAQMSVHKNVLKLIGCCLESEIPILVHEFAGNYKLLKDYISETQEMKQSQDQLPSWKHRIKIALDIANAVAYLHTALSRPVIYRDLAPHNIIIDEQSNYLAKLTNFSFCLSIPDGESHLEVDAIAGTMRFMAPEYCTRGYLTEKSDVYSYGVLLFCILTGCRRNKFFLDDDKSIWCPLVLDVDHVIDNRIMDVVDPALLQQGIEEGSLREFAILALNCVSVDADNRPTMIEVAKQLQQMYRSVPPS